MEINEKNNSSFSKVWIGGIVFLLVLCLVGIFYSSKGTYSANFCSGVFDECRSNEDETCTQVKKDFASEQECKDAGYTTCQETGVDGGVPVYIGTKTITNCLGTNDDDDNEDIEADEKSKTIEFKFYYDENNLITTASCVIPAGQVKCPKTLSTPGIQTKEGYTHTGWGNLNCETSTYGVNHAFDAATTSKNYYACFKKNEDIEKEEQTPNDFDSSKCTYSDLFTVTRDKNYLNCKYTNVGYGGPSASDNTVDNIKACCQKNGYTWVSGNFISGYEYCITDCKANTDVGGNNNTPDVGGNNNTPDVGGNNNTPDDTPSNDTGTPDNENVEDNPPTGSVAIFIAWIVGLGTLVYAFCYFKRTKKIKG